MPRLFALLVGVDSYKIDGSRKDISGNVVSLPDLHGCVNDVIDIRDYLLAVYGLDDPIVLTSPVAIDSLDRADESAQKPPTYDNIKSHFDLLYEQSSPGDLLYFHFSGHGARLSRVEASPGGRDTDPSLLPEDYCCGQPAIRGWVLNQWLKRFYEKRVQIFVSLDSCYAGDAWRGDAVRSPLDWTLPLNLPIDEIERELCDQNGRPFRIHKSWDINPGVFTLMTACGENETAAEAMLNGKIRGLFTNAVVSSLRRNRKRPITYRHLHDSVKSQIDKQTPELHGQDRLVFLGSDEPVLAVPLFARVVNQDALIPVGKMHGINVGTEFRHLAESSHAALTVYRVDEATSRAKTTAELRAVLMSHHEIYASRWSSKDVLKVVVDDSLGPEFGKLLYQALTKRIASTVDVSATRDTTGREKNTMLLSDNGHQGVDISGPFDLTGCPEAISYLETRGDCMEERIDRSCVALVHLFRFQQILRLSTDCSRNEMPFHMVLTPDGGESPVSGGGPVDNGTDLKLQITNSSNSYLFVTILNLGPGFHVQQLYPLSDKAYCMRPGLTKCLDIQVHVPPRLGAGPHRDIIRAVVTTVRGLSMKFLELPDIWDAGQMYSTWDDEPERHATMRSDRLDWWIKDIMIWTRKRSSAITDKIN